MRTYIKSKAPLQYRELRGLGIDSRQIIAQ